MDELVKLRTKLDELKIWLISAGALLVLFIIYETFQLRSLQLELQLIRTDIQSNRDHSDGIEYSVKDWWDVDSRGLMERLTKLENDKEDNSDDSTD